jgi:hypothetical protein
MAIRQSKTKSQMGTKRPKLRGRLKKKESLAEQRSHFRGTEDFNWLPMMDLLAYKQITNDPDHLIQLKESQDGWADLLTVRGQGVGTMSMNQQGNLIQGFYHFLQAYLEDVTFIISPFPVDTGRQQAFWGRRYERITQQIAREQNPRRRLQLQMQQRYIRDKQRTNIEVEKQLVSEEFIIVLFGKDKHTLRQNRQAAIQYGGSSLILEEISLEKKEETLFQINNLNTRVK